MCKRITTLALTVLLASCTSATGGERLRIMTLNAEWLVYTEDETDKDPWGPEYTLNEHYERIAGIIETLEPDVVNLVEVTAADGVDYLVAILHQKGLTSYTGHHKDGKDSTTGQDVAVIAKVGLLPIDGEELRQFYSENMQGPWRAEYTWTTSSGIEKHDDTSITKNIVYAIQVGATKLGFLGLHLRAIPDNVVANAVRTGQSKVAQKIIRDAIVAKGLTPIVLGDLNDFDPDVPDRDDGESTMTEVLRNLKDYDPNHDGAEMFNAAESIARKFDRYTAHHDKDKDRVPDEGESMTMIDHILLHETLRPFVKRVFIDHGHGGQTSDHWPVVVDLEFP